MFAKIGWWTGLVVVALAFGCDDGDSDGAGGDGGAGGATIDGGAGGAGGAGGDGGGEAAPSTYKISDLTLKEPGAVAPLIGNLLNSNLNNGGIILLVQVNGWDGATPEVFGGAAEQTGGADTPMDPSDDTFAWLTEGECADAEGNNSPCSVDLGQSTLTRTGEDFVSSKGELNIYARDLKAVIRLHEVVLAGTHDGIEMNASLDGVIPQSEAMTTRFRLTEQAELTDLETVLSMFNVEPDTMIDVGAGPEPAYTFAGDFNAAVVTFDE